MLPMLVQVGVVPEDLFSAETAADDRAGRANRDVTARDVPVGRPDPDIPAN